MTTARSSTASDSDKLAAKPQSIGRAPQFRRAFRFRRLRLGLGLDRLEFGALDGGRLDAGRYFSARRIGRARRLGRMQRARPRHGTGHQHLRRALVAEIAIGEAHARYRSAERAVIALVEIEAGLERKALDGSANGLAADLQRIARQAHMADRPRAAELYRSGRAEIIEHPAGTSGPVEAGKREHLAGH